MPKTDPLSAWLDDLREKAEAMPSGPFAEPVEDLEGGRIYWIQPHYPDMIAIMGEEHHARYFAALDRETVLALVAVVKATVNAEEPCEAARQYTESEGRTLAGFEKHLDAQRAALTAIVDAWDALRSLATERVR